jgi:hypothetical protein
MPRARKIETRMQDAKAVELRRRGLSYEQIAENLGFSAKSAAYEAVQRGLKDLYTEDTDGQRLLELERLDDMLRVLVRVALSKHRAAGRDGKLLLDEQGNPVYDDAINVTAALGVVKLSESRRKQFRLDAPTKSGVHVVTEDVIDAEIAKLTAELAGKDDHAPAGPRPA